MNEHGTTEGTFSRRCARRRGTAHLCLVLPIIAVTPMWATAQNASRPATSSAPTRPATSTPASGPAIPEDGLENIDLLSLEIQTVVTASRREQKLSTVPYAVSVITAEDIRRSGARNIPDALRLAPGVDVADIGYGSSAVSPRGFHGALSRSVLVLVDGRQIYDSVFGGTAWGSWPFQLEDIDRIEVIRGPGGVTWGSNAVNGVINIITKDPKDQPGLTMTGGGGSRGTHKEYLGYGFADPILRLRVSGEYESSDGFRDGGSLLGDLEDNFMAGRMSVQAIYEQSPKDTLTFSGGSAVVSGGYSPAPTGGIGMSKHTGSQASYLLGKWEHRAAADDRMTLTGYVNDFYLCAVGRSTDYRYQQLALQFNHVTNPADNHSLSWGVDSRTDLLDGTNADPYVMREEFVSTAIVGAYVQDEWRFAPRWTLNLGARIDYECYGGFQPSARAALSYELTDKSFLYGAVSRTFQMPPAGLRFTHYPLLNGLAHTEGRQNTKAETLLAYEIGYRKTFFDRLETTLAAYWHDLDELTGLRPRLGPPGLITLEYGNHASGASYGIEADARYAVTRQLLLQAHYTYEQLAWTGRASYSNKDVITPPKHKFMVGARYDLVEDLHLSSYLYYADTVTAPDSRLPLLTRQMNPYFRLDLRAEYEFWKKRASVAIGVRNLLDRAHQEGETVFLTNAEVPRMVYAEMRMTFR